MGPKSPSRRCPRPRFSKKSLEPFPSQILTPFSLSIVESVEPCINHRSSSTIPRKKVRLVVRSGNVDPAKEKRRDGGAKREIVPVPVRSVRTSPVSRTLRMSLKYWYSSCSFVSRGIVVILGASTVEGNVLVHGVA